MLKPEILRTPANIRANALRVLIDARKLGDGGIGVYIENLIGSLADLAESDPCWPMQISVIATAEKISRHSWASEINLIEDNSPLYSFDELFRLPRRIALGDFDVFHAPHFTLPYGLGIPAVVTIHDLIHVYNPPRLYYPIVAKPLIRSALSRAARIVSVSNATAEEVRRFCSFDCSVTSKLEVIPNVLAPDFISGLQPESGPVAAESPYFLAVLSNLKPHKGTEHLLEAFSALSSDEARLMLAGYGAAQIAQDPKLARAAESNPRIKVLGELSRAELSALYRGAIAVVVPSLVEGFCLPALEAHACATRVVARPIAALKELLSEADIFAEDMSVAALSTAMRSALESYGSFDRREWYARRIEVIKQRYSRQKAARALRDIYFTVSDKLDLAIMPALARGARGEQSLAGAGR